LVFVAGEFMDGWAALKACDEKMPDIVVSDNRERRRFNIGGRERYSNNGVMGTKYPCSGKNSFGRL
jgi:hypothetical protein